MPGEFDLEGKVAIITGGGKGMGKAMGIRLAGKGAKIVIAARDQSAMDQVVSEIKSKGGSAIAVKTDVSVRDSVHNMVKQAVDTFGTVHILVNNAGVTRRGYLVEMPEANWDFVMNTDLKGTFLTMQAVAPYMMKQHYGKIINISSDAAFAGWGLVANYAAAKAGVIALTKVAAHEWARHGIIVNVIAPGFVETEILGVNRSPQELEAFIANAKQGSVLRRLAEPWEIANLVLFLASDACNFITGQLICPEGGRIDYMGPW